MHELSIALSLLEVATDAAHEHHAQRVQAIHLKLGPLSGVVPQALQSAYEIARAEFPWPDCRLVIHEVELRGRCPACAAEGPLDSLLARSCAECGHFPLQPLNGDELEITSLEIE